MAESDEFVATAILLPLDGGQGDALTDVWRHWEELRAGRTLPDRSDIKPENLRPSLGKINLFDVLDSPRRYLIRLHGSTHVAVQGRDMHGQDTSAIRPPSYRELIEQHFAATVGQRTPLRHRLTLRMGRHSGFYDRLILPFTNGASDVGVLMTATSHTAEIMTVLNSPAYRRLIAQG